MQTRMPWPEFDWHLTGLMADPETLLARALAPADSSEEDDVGGG